MGFGMMGVIDETGFLKKGDQTAGVKRQYSGTAGRVENCQIGIFLTYTTERGHTLIDRELYLLKDWAADEGRRAAAHVPDSVSFEIKPALARQMLERSRTNGVCFKWVTADSIHSSDPSAIAYYVVYAPVDTTIDEWVCVAGQRWTLEESFEHAKDELGLDTS